MALGAYRLDRRRGHAWLGGEQLVESSKLEDAPRAVDAREQLKQSALARGDRAPRQTRSLTRGEAASNMGSCGIRRSAT